MFFGFCHSCRPSSGWWLQNPNQAQILHLKVFAGLSAIIFQYRQSRRQNPK